MPRIDGRKTNQLRPVSIQRNFLPNAEGSALISLGETKVLVTATIEETIPQWLKEQARGCGWITAEYGMLPRSTLTRISRDKAAKSGRTHEIQRLIGRTLRAVVDLKQMGERTLIVDCDVLQADGGTRTAAITGAVVAVIDAFDLLRQDGKMTVLPVKEMVAAISVGKVEGEWCLDLNYQEDSQAEVDSNLAITENGQLVEIQGTAEKGSFSRDELMKILDLAGEGVAQLIELQKSALREPL